MKRFLPRQGDLPIKELTALADRAILNGGGPTLCEVHFKFTCSHCGARCTFQEPNQLYAEGECAKCGKVTKILVAGFSLTMKIVNPANN